MDVTINNPQPYMVMSGDSIKILQQTASLISSIIWLYDLDEQKIVFANDQLQKLLGYATNTITSIDMKHLFSDHDQPLLVIKTEAALNGTEKDKASLDCHLVHRSGQLIPFHVKCSAFHTHSEEIHPNYLLFAAEKINDEVINSTENELLSTLNELHRSNQDLEEFAYVASHDLQEPLRKISTFSGRIVSKYADQLDEEGLMYLNRILAATTNMRTLIDDLLEFSRAIQPDQHFAETNLNDIIQQVSRDLELVIEETGTTIQYDNLPEIRAVGPQIKQLLYNIINNAIKFRQDGVAPVITIKATQPTAEELVKYRLSPKKRYQKLVITDNGIGFEEEYAERIFKIFQRLHGKAEYPGSGIGLAICKKIVDHHEGAIYAENIPEQGARFSIILPQ